jgi:hypothetical protein
MVYVGRKCKAPRALSSTPDGLDRTYRHWTQFAVATQWYRTPCRLVGTPTFYFGVPGFVSMSHQLFWWGFSSHMFLRDHSHSILPCDVTTEHWYCNNPRIMGMVVKTETGSSHEVVMRPARMQSPYRQSHRSSQYCKSSGKSVLRVLSSYGSSRKKCKLIIIRFSEQLICIDSSNEDPHSTKIGYISSYSFAPLPSLLLLHIQYM